MPSWYEQRFEERPGRLRAQCRACGRAMWFPPSKIARGEACDAKCRSVLMATERPAKVAAMLERGRLARAEARNRPIDRDAAMAALSYDPETGLFTWRTAARGRVVGAVAGSLEPNGYVEIGINRHRIRAHRLAWLFAHGSMPHGEIDHINGIRHDNRIANLRDVPTAINRQNLRKGYGKTGLLGVKADGNRFSAKIRANGILRHLGMFATPEEAHAAYVEAKRALHPGSTL